MMTGQHVIDSDWLARNPFDALPDVISAIGEERFGSQLLTLLSEACGAEHCAAFQFIDHMPTGVMAASIDGTDTASRQSEIYLQRKIWMTDPLMSEAEGLVGHVEPRLMRLDIASLPNNELRNVVYARAGIRERILLCGDIGGTRVGLSLLRSDAKGQFSAAEVRNLSQIAATLLAVIAKHSGTRIDPPNLSVALTTLPEIEACIGTAPEGLSGREAEVCSRILYGITTLGIALDLNIGEETVMTYRKRAYHRLQIGCQRELLLWYIGLWTRWQHKRVRTH